MGLRIFLLSLLIGLTQFSFAKEINVKTQIESVTIFSRGAQIERTFNASLPKGRHTLVISNLENGIDANTIQLGGSGNFLLLSVSHRQNHLLEEKDNDQLKSLRDSLELLTRQKNLLGNKRDAMDSERKMIVANQAQPNAEGHITVQELTTRANFFRERLTKVGAAIIDLDIELKEVQEDVQRIQQQINQFGQKRKYVGEIAAEVLVNADTRANLNLAYAVRNAGWSPQYDLRAEQIGDAITLQYNAKVWQRTGQDWKNVSLSLSTGDPFANKNKPTLYPWRLNFLQDNAGIKDYSNRKFEQEAEAASVPERAKNLSVSDDMGTPTSSIQQNATNFQFDIEEPYDISGDGQQQHVIVDELELKAKYDYYTAPKLRRSVFLLAKVYDWHQYNLLSGQANLFFKNTYVGKSHINANSTDDTLSLSLGTDERLNVQRERIDDYCKTSNFGNSKKESIGIKITLKNNGPKTVTIDVQDQFPIPGNGEIEVKLIEDSDAKIDEDKGFLNWTVELPPGASKELIFKYEVKLPKDKRVRL